MTTQTDNPEQIMVRVPVKERPKREPLKEPQKQPPHAVIIHDDDVNSIEFVVMLIQKVFGYGLNKAVEHTLEVHTKGRSIVWTGMKEPAELKADQVRSCGPDPINSKASPLRVTVEPLPE